MYNLVFKRVIDFLVAFLGLLILSPLFIILTICLFFSNKGKPFFFQERPGKGERIFKIIKFKSMNDKKDKNGQLLPDRERLTSLGAFVRKTSLDEIPQLINVLKGDMSLIGPRPLLVNYLAYYTDRERLRHTVRPGITGLSQVNCRNNPNWDDKLKYDVLYVENISLKNDILIFFKTLVKVLKQKNVTIIPSEKGTTLDKYRKENINA